MFLKKTTLPLRSLVALSAAAVLVALPGAAHAQASNPGTTLTVHKKVSDDSDPAGFNFTVESTNCELPSDAQTSAVTNSDGTAVFEGLVYAQGDTTCLYDVTEVEKPGYEQVTSSDELKGLTLGEFVTEEASLSLTEASGVFSNATRNPEPNGNTLEMFCLIGEGTNEIRAGRVPRTSSTCPAVQNRSGLRFDGAATPAKLGAGNVELGTLTHMNNTIQRGLHNVNLKTTLVFTDTKSGETKTVESNYTVAIDETNDNTQNCKYPDATDADGKNANGTLLGFGCADKVTISPVESQSLEFGGFMVDLTLSFGHKKSNGSCSAPISSAFTAEGRDTTFCLFADLTPVKKFEPRVVEVVNKVLPKPTPTEPTEQPTEPTTQPTEPTAQPTGPTTQPTQPSEPSSAPSTNAPGVTTEGNGNLPRTGGEIGMAAGVAAVLIAAGVSSLLLVRRRSLD